MNWKVEKGTAADAGTIAEFQIDMALESEGALLDRELILKGGQRRTVGTSQRNVLPHQV